MFEKVQVKGQLPQLWPAFAATPDVTTAEALADELNRLRQRADELNRLRQGADDGAGLQSALGDIAAALAARTPLDQATMFPLLASKLEFTLARDLLKAVGQLPASTPDPRTARGRDIGDPLDRLIDDVLYASTRAYLKYASAVVNFAVGSELAYSAERRKELMEAVQGTAQDHLVEQIGFRTSKSLREETGGLTVANEYASNYWRTDFAKQLEALKDKGLKDRLALGADGVLVSSPRVLDKLGMMVDPTVLADLTIKPVTGESGLSVLHGTRRHPDPDPERWDHILREIGATPSAYQLYKLIDAGKPAPNPDFTLDTWADLMVLVTSSPFSQLRKIGLGQDEVAPACALVEHLVLGLTAMPPERRDTLTASALGSLSRLLEIIVGSEANPPVAYRAVDLMMDEIGIIVAAAAPYSRTDYQNTMLQVLLERAPSLGPLIEGQAEAGPIQVQNLLMTSGMDALATALWIALSSRGHDQVSRPTGKIDYFETGEFLDKLRKGQAAAPRRDVLVAALNPSTPVAAPSAKTLVTDVMKGLQEHKPGNLPFALILDTTVEVAPGATGGAHLDDVLGGLKDVVAAGRLEIFLCKSFHKYASFGAGKVAAGGLTVLTSKNNRDSAPARADAVLHDMALDLARYDEGQLVIHLLTYGHRDELALIGSAADNAKFVNLFCWPIDRTNARQGSTYVDGIPLLLRSISAVSTADTTRTIDHLLEKLTMIDWRDSFSFLRTSFVGGIDEVDGVQGPFVRINTGHESKEAMVEYFYAFGHLFTGTLPGQPKVTPSVGLAPPAFIDVKRHLDALRGIPQAGTALTGFYWKNIEASYCLFALQIAGAVASEVWPVLVGCFQGPGPGQGPGLVTIETQRYLARKLFEGLPDVTIPADKLAGTLVALRRAADALPAWEYKAIAVKRSGRLRSLGDSEDAQWLRRVLPAPTTIITSGGMPPAPPRGPKTPAPYKPDQT